MPPSFSGTTNPLEAESWVFKMEKIFKFLGCTNSQKVNYATYMFEGPAEIRCYNDAHELLTGNMVCILCFTFFFQMFFYS